MRRWQSFLRRTGMKNLKQYFDILKKAAHAFVEDNALKLSASLSYYMVFALGPIVLIVITLAGSFFGKDAVQGKVYTELSKLLGKEAALQIELIIRNTQGSHDSTIRTTIGLVALFLGATGVFAEIQDSINYIWSVK